MLTSEFNLFYCYFLLLGFLYKELKCVPPVVRLMTIKTQRDGERRRQVCITGTLHDPFSREILLSQSSQKEFVSQMEHILLISPNQFHHKT